MGPFIGKILLHISIGRKKAKVSKTENFEFRLVNLIERLFDPKKFIDGKKFTQGGLVSE